MTDELRRICQQLKPIIGESAEALWMQYELAESPTEKFEASQLIRMTEVTHLGKRVNDSKVWLAPPQNAQGDIHLGDALYPGCRPRPFHLKLSDMSKHVGIFATTGSGKTNLAYHLLKQLKALKIPFLVIDWKRSYRNLLKLRSMKGLKVYTVGRTAAPFDWNPLRPPPNVHPRTWIQLIAEVLGRTHVSGEGVADLLMEHADKEFEARGFYDEGDPKGYPNFYDLRNRIERTRYGGRRALWRDSCLRILRTFTFGPQSEAFNSRDPVKLETLLENPVVLELDMEFPRSVRTFLSELILRWIHLYRLGQGESLELRHVLVLEEAHNVFPRISESHPNGGLENLYREIRSYGESLISISQHPSLLPIYILGNTHTLVFLMLNHELDIITARQSLFLKRGEEVYLDRLRTGEGIVKVKGQSLACHARFPLVKVKPGAVRDEDLSK